MAELVTPGDRLGLAVRPCSLQRCQARRGSRWRRPKLAMLPFECRSSAVARRRRSLPTAALQRLLSGPPSPARCAQSEYDAGAGTCVRDAFICATLVGEKRVLPAAEGESEQVRRRSSSVQPVRVKRACRWR